MENETIISQFDDIEKKVDRLIETCKSLENTNMELINKIEIMENDFQIKVEAENNFLKERDHVKFRIEGLLAKLEDNGEVQIPI